MMASPSRSSHSHSSSLDSTLHSDEEYQEDASMLAEYKDSAQTPVRASMETDWSGFDGSYRPRWTKRAASHVRKLREYGLTLVYPLQKLLVREHTLTLTYSLPKLLLLLLPSFIYPWAPATTTPTKLHPTAYLDGLRGVAAFFVCVSHYACQFAPALLEGWNSGPTAEIMANNRWMLQLPIIRIVHSGHFMVWLFYVISGFVLSARGLKLARNGKQAQFASSLVSSVFRRYLRLHLPVVASMFIAMLISRSIGWGDLKPDWLAPSVAAVAETSAGAVGASPAALAAETSVGAVVARALGSVMVEKPVPRLYWHLYSAPKFAVLSDQLWDLWAAIEEMCDPFRYGAVAGGVSSRYNAGVLWTIPAEWLGSMVIFLTVLGLAWTRTWLRLAILFVLVIFCHRRGKWEIGTFISGIFIAEITLIRAARAAAKSELEGAPLPTNEKEEAPEERSFAVRWKDRAISSIWITLFVIGVYLGSRPLMHWTDVSESPTTVVWVATWFLPGDRYWLALGSLLIMFSVTSSSCLQRVFTMRFPQYLGRISFSLYLLHCQIITSFGISWMTSCMKFVGGGMTQVGFVMGLTLGSLILFPITFWTADVFCRLVDENTVAFGRWSASKFLILDD